MAFVEDLAASSISANPQDPSPLVQQRFAKIFTLGQRLRASWHRLHGREECSRNAPDNFAVRSSRIRQCDSLRKRTRDILSDLSVTNKQKARTKLIWTFRDLCRQDHIIVRILPSNHSSTMAREMQSALVAVDDKDCDVLSKVDYHQPGVRSAAATCMQPSMDVILPGLAIFAVNSAFNAPDLDNPPTCPVHTLDFGFLPPTSRFSFGRDEDDASAFPLGSPS